MYMHTAVCRVKSPVVKCQLWSGGYLLVRFLTDLYERKRSRKKMKAEVVRWHVTTAIVEFVILLFCLKFVLKIAGFSVGARSLPTECLMNLSGKCKKKNILNNITVVFTPTTTDILGERWKTLSLSLSRISWFLAMMAAKGWQCWLAGQLAGLLA